MNAQSFRLNCQNLFLTFPQCNLEKEDMLEHLHLKLDKYGMGHYVVAREKHQDGNLHLHCAVRLAKRCNITKSNYLDVGGFHGNYQAARGWAHVVKYCAKHGDILTNLSSEELETLKGRGNAEKAGMRRKVGEKVMAGEELKDIVEEYPNLIFGYSKLKLDIEDYKKDQKEPNPDLDPWIPNPWGLLLPSGYNKKKRHYWIYSRLPDRGKTTWAKELVTKFRGFIKSGDFTYWNIRGDEQLLILDEYNTARLKWDTLNQLADGTFEFRIFMGGLRNIHSRYMVIILSNQSISDLYPHMFNFIQARFIEKELL